ncbi:hypothetical protein SJAV_18820 [Sulfurisphaera javensis]|uniref:Hydrogenase maturation protease n=1 Tax=Sulfurisphaera javensis TaxID=2049879 RepID=A0AAT9GSV0_9CREN
MKRIAIVGVGNRLMGDDGLGSYLAEALQGNVKGCEVIDLGASGIASFEILKDFDIIIILDAIMMEDKDFDIIKVNNEIDSDELTSTVLDFEYSGSHGLGIQSVLTTLRIMGYFPEVYIVGCRHYVLDVKMGLSKELSEKLENIVIKLADFVKKFNIEIDIKGVLEKLNKVMQNNY